MSVLFAFVIGYIKMACNVVIKEAGDGESANWTNLYDLEGPQSTPESPNYSKNFPSKEEAGKAEGKEQHGDNRDGPKLLPFEFVALEACLEAACSCLDNEVDKFWFPMLWLLYWLLLWAS